MASEMVTEASGSATNYGWDFPEASGSATNYGWDFKLLVSLLSLEGKIKWDQITWVRKKQMLEKV